MQLTATNLSELIRSLRSHSVEGDKRKHPRVGLRAKAEVVLEGETIPVWIRDISSGGANFSCPHEMPPDAAFDLMLSATDKICCVVRHCRRNSPTLYSIGARFIDDVKGGRRSRR